MCAANSPCRSPPRSGSPSKGNPDYRFPQQQPPQPPPPPPYVYYPPPYPPYNPYAPYHPGAFYSSPYCNDVTQESKGLSWISIFLIIFLLLGIGSVIFYLSRDTRRRINAGLPTLIQPAQDYNRGERVL
ncbi:leucine-rich repeat extensin-like protein 6 [Osmia bicornis bicornis]|uniref:leucine-rich repeat extensin-like protein 6 n=1 Tax=Osmia bicornis bicornis TaxID=1437191 RepID=UPI001EAEF916|nr:leucine-rich repeat extensin-like protein 6 [Osmia bicornis bicornis]